MPVLLQQTLPEGVTLEILDEMTEAMGVDADPPPGLLVHVHYESGGKVRILDVWDSPAQLETFQQQRLGPAMAKVGAARGVDFEALGQPETTVTEVHRVLKGR